MRRARFVSTCINDHIYASDAGVGREKQQKELETIRVENYGVKLMD